MAVNDPSEISFGGTTQQIQTFGRIGLTNAGGVDQVKRNGDFYRALGKIKSRQGGKDKNERSIGIFHTLSEEMKMTLLLMAREDSEETRVYDQTAITQQRKEKQRKWK